MGGIHLVHGDHELAQHHFSLALREHPGNAHILAHAARYHAYTGDSADAVTLVNRARQLNPFHPAWYLWTLGEAYYMAGRYTEALVPLQEGASRNRKARWGLVATLAQLERVDEAGTILQELVEDRPQATLQREQWFKNREDEEHWLDGLRKSGLTE